MASHRPLTCAKQAPRPGDLPLEGSGITPAPIQATAILIASHLGPRGRHRANLCTELNQSCPCLPAGPLSPGSPPAPTCPEPRPAHPIRHSFAATVLCPDPALMLLSLRLPSGVQKQHIHAGLGPPELLSGAWLAP